MQGCASWTTHQGIHLCPSTMTVAFSVPVFSTNSCAGHEQGLANKCTFVVRMEFAASIQKVRHFARALLRFFRKVLESCFPEYVYRDCLQDGTWFSCQPTIEDTVGWTNFSHCWSKTTQKLMDDLNIKSSCPTNNTDVGEVTVEVRGFVTAHDAFISF